MRGLSLLLFLCIGIIAVSAYTTPASSSYSILQPRFAKQPVTTTTSSSSPNGTTGVSASLSTGVSSTGAPADDLPKDFKLLSEDPHPPSPHHSDRAVDPTAAIFGANPDTIYANANKKHLYEASIEMARKLEEEQRLRAIADAAAEANRTGGSNSTAMGTPANPEESLPIWGKTIRYLNNIEQVLKQFDQNATQ